MLRKKIDGLEIPFGISSPNKMYSTDAYAGPYDSIDEGLETIKESLRTPGRKFGVYADENKNEVLEYVFKLNENNEWVVEEIGSQFYDNYIFTGKDNIYNAIINYAQLYNGYYGAFYKQKENYIIDNINNFKKTMIIPKSERDRYISFRNKFVYKTEKTDETIENQVFSDLLGALFITEFINIDGIFEFIGVIYPDILKSYESIKEINDEDERMKSLHNLHSNFINNGGVSDVFIDYYELYSEPYESFLDLVKFINVYVNPTETLKTDEEINDIIKNNYLKNTFDIFNVIKNNYTNLKYIIDLKLNSDEANIVSVKKGYRLQTAPDHKIYNSNDVANKRYVDSITLQSITDQNKATRGNITLRDYRKKFNPDVDTTQMNLFVARNDHNEPGLSNSGFYISSSNNGNIYAFTKNIDGQGTTILNLHYGQYALKEFKIDKIDPNNIANQGFTAIGHYSLNSLTSGNRITAVGYSSGSGIKTGNHSVVIGSIFTGPTESVVGSALIGANFGGSVTKADMVVAIGHSCALFGKTLYRTILIGNHAGYGLSGDTKHNTIIGPLAGYALAESSYNTLIGNQAGYVLKNSFGNTVLGSWTGVNGLNNHIVLARTETGSSNDGIGFIVDDLGRTRVPLQTIEEIEKDITGKTVITKEYFNSYFSENVIYIDQTPQTVNNQNPIEVNLYAFRFSRVNEIYLNGLKLRKTDYRLVSYKGKITKLLITNLSPATLALIIGLSTENFIIIKGIKNYSNLETRLVYRTTTPNESITLPISETTTNEVVWDENNTTTGTNTFIYAQPGDHEIIIKGIITDFGKTNATITPSRNKLIEVREFGGLVINRSGMFNAYTNVSFDNLVDIPNITSTSLSSMFRDVKTITKIPFIEQWDVSSTNDFSSMFYNCNNLEMDLSGWNVSNGIIFTNMFQGCSKFNSDLSGWNVGNATNLAGLFHTCRLFNSDLSNWDVSNATTFLSMFQNASVFNSDLSNWDVSNATNLGNMFYEAKMFNGDISTWNTSNVTTLDSTFSGCINFDSDISGWDVSNVKNTFSTFNGCSVFNQDLSKWNLSNSTTAANMFKDCKQFNSDLTNLGLENVITMESFLNACTNFNGDVSNLRPGKCTNFKNVFINTYFNGDISNWDVSSGKDFAAMFQNCRMFNSDLSGWDVGNATIMSYMFINCERFNSDLSGWNVSNVTNFSNMFNGASVFNGDISTWDTSSALLLTSMFYNAKAFNQDISKWDLSKATSISQMLGGTTSFNSDISGWDVSNVTNFSYTFQNTIFNYDLSKWDVKKGENFMGMFYNAKGFNCDLSEWVLENATTTNSMFNSASVFNGEISNFGLSKVTNIDSMFQGAVAFNQDISKWTPINMTTATNFMNGKTINTYSPENLTNIYKEWSKLPLKKVNISFGNAKYYSDGQEGKNTLIQTFGWTITDGGVAT